MCPELHPRPDPGRPRTWAIAGSVAVVGVLLTGAIYNTVTSDDKEATVCSPDVEKDTNKPMTVPKEYDTSRAENLLAKGEWCYTPGISVTKKGLQVRPTGMAILNLPEDAAGRPPKQGIYSPNLPLNLMSHVAMDKPGDVGIATRLTNIQEYATVTVAAGPDLRYDERTMHEPQVQVMVGPSSYRIMQIDRRGGSLKKIAEVQRTTLGTAADILITQKDGATSVIVDGVAYPKTFPGHLQKEAWLGFDGMAGITQLDAYPLVGNTVHMTSPDDYLKGVAQTEDGLYGTAKANGLGDRRLSTAIDLTEVMGNPAYARFVAENFNQLEPAMAAKWQALQPQEGMYAFGELDAIVRFAGEHGMDVHGHALDFTEAYPQWLQDKLQNLETTPAMAEKLLHDHIYTVVKRYDGQEGRLLIKRWDVVNEPFDPDTFEDLNKQNIWYKKLGAKHIEIALRAAREANPDGEFYINEWGETDEDRQGAIKDLAADLSKKGLLDGVGLQGHFFEEDVKDDDIMSMVFDGGVERFVGNLTTLKNSKGQPLRVRFSEISVPTDDDPAHKARVYAKLTQIFVNNPNVDWGVWGAASKDDYMTADGHGDPGDDAIAIQRTFRTGPIETTPAYTAIRKALAEHK